MSTAKKLLAIAAFGASAITCASAFAQYVGPSAAVPTYRSVADVLKNPVEDAPVALEGYLTKKVAKEKYMFSDGKNEIKVEIDNEDFPTTPVNEKTRVQIRGEVGREILRNPEIDVKHVLIVK